MSRNNPGVQTDTLYYQQGQQTHSLKVDTPEWYYWLKEAILFTFTNGLGSFTARKEPASNRRGGSYWRAYRKKEGKLYRVYLGKDQELSLVRLNRAAQELLQQPNAAVVVERRNLVGKPDSAVANSFGPAHNSNTKETGAKTTPAKNEASEPESLIATKLFMPALPQSLVPRSRLTRQLNEAGSRSRLILVSAPSGFGKTTAVIEWLNQAPPAIAERVAWVSLDDGDNEPIRFWSYLYQSVDNVQPGLNLSQTLRTAQPPSLEQMSARLINALTVTNQSLTIVLDDYHLIKSPQIHEGVTLLLERLPAQVRLVITSRVDPPLPLARLRLRLQLTELRVADLSFNLEEAKTFFKARTGLDLAPPHLQELEERTEGWIAALQLATLLVQSHHDIDSFIQKFGTGQRFMLDYLVEEVLQAQPEATQHFLIQTAMLERLTAPLVEELTGSEDGQGMLENLLKANLFLIPLDDEHKWYRYHHLFRQHLLRHLEQTQAEHLPLLHRWASSWFEGAGLVQEAIEHSLKAADFERAAELIDGFTQEMYGRNELRTMWGWLEKLPRETLEAHPHSPLNCAWVLLLLNRHEATRPYVELVQELLERPAIVEKLHPLVLQAYRGELAAVQAFLARNEARFDLSIELARQALELIAPNQGFLRCAILTNQGYCYAALDDLPAAIQEFAQTETLARSIGNIYFLLVGLTFQAKFQAQQGHLRQAEAICRRAQAVEGSKTLPVLSGAFLELGNLWREWNDLGKAAENLQKADQLLEQRGDLSQISVHLGLARVRQAQSDAGGAMQELEKAEGLLFGFNQPLWQHQIEQGWAWFWLANGELASVENWINSQLVKDRLVSPQLREIDYLLTARLHLAQKRPVEAFEAAATAGKEAEHAGRRPVQLESLILQAQALWQQGHKADAFVKLRLTLEMAQPEGFVRLFLDEGPPLIEMLEILNRQLEAEQSDPVQASYMARLLASRQPTMSQSDPPTQSAAVTVSPPMPERPARPVPKTTALVEPLTEREQEVLRLLVTTALDTTAIADELSIAVSTLRTHIKNIYSKLDVQSRLQAITRAQELSLVKS